MIAKEVNVLQEEIRIQAGKRLMSLIDEKGFDVSFWGIPVRLEIVEKSIKYIYGEKDGYINYFENTEIASFISDGKLFSDNFWETCDVVHPFKPLMLQRKLPISDQQPPLKKHHI